jgi:hypothetical protein
MRISDKYGINQTCFHQALVVGNHDTIYYHTTFRKMDITPVILLEQNITNIYLFVHI